MGGRVGGWRRVTGWSISITFRVTLLVRGMHFHAPIAHLGAGSAHSCAHHAARTAPSGAVMAAGAWYAACCRLHSAGTAACRQVSTAEGAVCGEVSSVPRPPPPPPKARVDGLFEDA